MQIVTIIDPKNLKTFLEPISAKYQTNIQREFQESVLQLPIKRGQGKITAYSFPYGTSLIIFNFTPKEDIDLDIYAAPQPPIQFIFCVEGSLGVMEVAEQVGYLNSSHFARRFKDKYGVLPKDYQKHIQSTIIKSAQEKKPQSSR